jgi:2-haloacid dehalogenase
VEGSSLATAESNRMALTGVRSLVFDVFGTVVDWRSSVIREAEVWLAPYGVNLGRFADAWRSLYSPSLEEVRSGRRPFVRLDVLHRENLESVLCEFGVALSGRQMDSLNLAWHRLDPWPDCVAGLERLRSRYVVAPLSNGNIAMMIDIARRSGLRWDAILGAELTQIYKPLPEAYLRTAEVLALQPEQIALVAAHNSDLAAARKSGFRTVFIPRPTEHGHEQSTDLVPEQQWDLVASDLEQLAGMLGL